MQATEEAVAVTASPPETPDAPAPTPDQGELILSLLQQMSTELRALGQRVEAVEKNDGPRFVPSTPETYMADYERHRIADQAPPDKMPRSMKIPVMSDGIKIPDVFLAEFPARFRDGMRVRLNPDVVPHGRTDGKTRGELMTEAGMLDLPGEVIYRTYLTRKVRQDGRRGVWKYRVQFPRETITGATNGIVQLHEPELLPA